MANTTYTCTGCVPIDKSILAAYAALVGLNATAQTAEAGRVTAEEGRVAAEEERVAAEAAREAAKTVVVEGYYDAGAEKFVPRDHSASDIAGIIEGGGMVVCSEQGDGGFEPIISLSYGEGGAPVFRTYSWTLGFNEE